LTVDVAAAAGTAVKPMTATTVEAMTANAWRILILHALS
jgi:hypothetical protein